MRYIVILDWDGTVQSNYAFSILSSLMMQKGILNKSILTNPHILKILKSMFNHDFLARQGMKLICEHIKGINESDVIYIIEEYKRINDQYIYPIMKNTIFPFFRNNGIEIIVISGSPMEAIKPYQQEFGIDKIYATQFDIKSGIYTGGIECDTGTSKGKDYIVRNLFQSDANILFSFGDSPSDVSLFQHSYFSFVNNLGSKFFKDDNIMYLDFSNNGTGEIIIKIMSDILSNRSKELARKLVV